MRLLVLAAATVFLAACGDEGGGNSAPAADRGHVEEHIAEIRTRCMDEYGHEGFCECGVEAVHAHVLPDHIDTSDGTAVISSEIPDDHAENLSAAAIACEVEHLQASLDSDAELDHLAYFKDQCVDHHDNEAYCDCSVAALEDVLTGEHVVTEGEHAGLSPEVPTAVITEISSALNQCEAQHPLDEV
ncbi:MAG: hypothetical protein ACE363_07725 [Alphaproteobacteria bacterium]